MKNIRKMSRMPVRLSTNSRPSRDSSSPARQPSRVDRVSRRATRHMMRIATVPNTAGATRQPTEFRPNSHSPTAIASLPNGGCTTYSPQAAPLHALKMLVCPAMIRSFALCSGFHSTPCIRIDQASLA
jgi:hypothetical protein